MSLLVKPCSFCDRPVAKGYRKGSKENQIGDYE